MKKIISTLLLAFCLAVPAFGQGQFSGGGSSGTGGSTTFDKLGSGTNTTGSLVCGTGCTFSTSGSGTNQATSLTGITTGYIAYGSASALTGDALFTHSASTGTVFGAPSGTGVALTVTGDANSSNIFNVNMTGGSGGNGFKIASNGNTTVGGTLTVGSGTLGSVSLGTVVFNGSGSGSATVGVSSTAGTPAQLNLPTTTGFYGQDLQTDGGSPQQASWRSPIGVPSFSGTPFTVGYAANCTSATPQGFYDSATGVGTSPVTGNVAATTSVLCLDTAQTKSSTPTSGDVAGDIGQIQVKLQGNTIFDGYFKIDDQASGSLRWWMGLFPSGSTQAGADAPNQSYAALRYSTGASDTNFMCVVANSTVNTTATSSTVAADANQHYLKIVVNSAFTHVFFWIDGVQKCDLSTNLPTANTMVGPGTTITTLTSAQRKMSFHHTFATFPLY